MLPVGPPHDRERLELRLPVQVTSVTISRRAAAQFAEEAGVPEPVVWRVRLAVSEAVSNVVLHAHPDEGPTGHHLVLEAHVGGAGLDVVVTDHGVGPSPREDSPGLGAGLAVMGKCCDHLTVEPGPDGGTVVRMAFALDA